MLKLAFDKLELQIFELSVVVHWMFWFIHNKVATGVEKPKSSSSLPFNFAWLLTFLAGLCLANSASNLPMKSLTSLPKWKPLSFAVCKLIVILPFQYLWGNGLVVLFFERIGENL